MNKATLQPDGSWKVETMTADEETDWKGTVESGKTLKHQNHSRPLLERTHRLEHLVRRHPTLIEQQTRSQHRWFHHRRCR